MQALHGILGGISCDHAISENELRPLDEWLTNHADLRTYWPYEEIASLASSVLADGKIDAEEHKMLITFLSGWSSIDGSKSLSLPRDESRTPVMGICAICPTITLASNVFCFTGESTRCTRQSIADVIKKAKGIFSKLDFCHFGVVRHV
jgi:hypothetical protein